MTTQFTIIDVSEWPEGDEPERMGTRGKEWLVEPDTDPEVPWLFKAIRCKDLPKRGRRCFDEDWAELLATEAAGMLGVPAAEVRLAVRHEDRGVISRSLLVDVDGTSLADGLTHGNELLQAQDPRYDKDQVREAVGYTLNTVWQALDGISAPPGSPQPVVSAAHAFAGYLVLDALVAGTDRHHENWGALHWGTRRWLAPSYDHGTCLGFQLEDEMRTQYLDGNDSATMDVWVMRGTSSHFEGRPGLVYLATDALTRVPLVVRDHWYERIESFDLESWWDTLSRVPSPLMSHPARRFAYEVVRLNRERLLE